MIKQINILAILCFIFLFGCSNGKRLADGKPLIPREPHHILKQSKKAVLDWDWIGFKMHADVKANGNLENFTVNVRMARDSAIWVSLTPALGVEVARILLDPDSVRVISKVPKNKFVYSGDYDQLQDFLGVPFDFYTFQELFSGTSLGLDPSNEKFVSKVDRSEYVLIEKFPRKVKKLLGGIDERGLAGYDSDSLSLMMNHRRANRMLNKTDSDELLIKRYWFDGVTFAPTVDVFNDLKSGLAIKVERFGDEEHSEGVLPSKTILTAFGDGVNLEAELDIRRSRINREYDLPFDPPAEYERRSHL